MAVKLAVVPPAATVTGDGADNTPELVASATVEPPAGAAALSVTVHVVEAPDATLVALHFSEDTVAAGAVSAIEADSDSPFSVAVTVAL